MEKQKEKMKGLQESTARWDHYNETDEIKQRTFLTLTLKQFIAGMLISWCAYTFTGGLIRGSYFWETTESSQEAIVAELETKLKNQYWLWHTHNLQAALLEDDGRLLELRDDNGVSAFEFLQKATTIRRNGFLMIALDDNHPNLRAWLQANHPDKVAAYVKLNPMENKWERRYYAEVARGERKRADEKNKLQFMFGLFFNNDKELETCDLSKLPEDWEPFYQSVVDRLIETNSKKVLHFLEGSRIHEQQAQDKHPILVK